MPPLPHCLRSSALLIDRFRDRRPDFAGMLRRFILDEQQPTFFFRMNPVLDPVPYDEKFTFIQVLKSSFLAISRNRGSERAL